VSRQVSSLITAINMGALLSTTAKAVTVGGVAWTPKQAAKEGIINVRTALASPLAPCRLRIVVNPLAPSEPKLQYLVGDGRERFSARRLCVNVPPRPISGTHKHRAEPGTGDEGAYQPLDIPSVPLQPRVAPGTYRAILEAFAAECFVEVGPDFTWIDP